MSANEGTATKSRGKEYATSIKFAAQLGITTSVTSARPHFHNHTQSSLLKKKEPVRPGRRRSLTRTDAGTCSTPLKSERNVAPLSRLSGISKKSRVAKQSKSMHSLKTIIKREIKDCQSFDSLRSDSKQTISRHEPRTRNSLVFLQHNLVNDVSCDFKMYTESSTGLLFFQDETPEFVDQPEERSKNMRAPHHNDQMRYISHDAQQCTKSSSKNDHNFPKDRSSAKISHKLQINSNDSKGNPYEVEILHRGMKLAGSSEKSPSISSNENHPIESQICKQARSTNIQGMMIPRRMQTQQKIWINGKATGRSEVDRACHANVRGNVKFIKHKDCIQGKNLRSFMGSKTVSCQKNYVPQKKKHSSVEHVRSYDSKSKNTSISPKQTKALMKENRDPSINRVTKIYKSISQSTKTIGTQTSPRCNKNVAEVGCNTTPQKSSRKDASISCDLINWTNLRTDLTTIENGSMTEDVPIHEIKLNASVEKKNLYENKEFLTSEYKEALNAEMSLKSENYVNTETILLNYNNITATSSAEIDTIRDFTTDLTMDKIIYEEKTSKNKICLESSKECNDWMNTTYELQESIRSFKDHEVNNDLINDLSSGSNDKLLSLESSPPLRLISNYDTSYSSSFDEVTEYLKNDVQYNEIIVPELKLENISGTLIAAFQLATERVRNLHQAVILYKEHLMTKLFEKQNEETTENSQTSSIGQHYIQNKTSFESCDNKNEIRSECESGCHFIMKRNEDFDVLSSSSSDSDRTYESELQSSGAHRIDSEVGRAEMNAILPRGEEATENSVLNERINFVLANVKSSLCLLVHRVQKRLVPKVENSGVEVEILADSDDGRFTPEKETSETSMFPVIREIKIISQQVLFLLLCCAVIILFLWYFHVLFAFNCFP